MFHHVVFWLVVRKRLGSVLGADQKFRSSQEGQMFRLRYFEDIRVKGGKKHNRFWESKLKQHSALSLNYWKVLAWLEYCGRRKEGERKEKTSKGPREAY